jgi:hypothetical protein
VQPALGKPDLSSAGRPVTIGATGHSQHDSIPSLVLVTPWRRRLALDAYSDAADRYVMDLPGMHRP